jgi:hypothetical protein
MRMTHRYLVWERVPLPYGGVLRLLSIKKRIAVHRFDKK